MCCYTVYYTQCHNVYKSFYVLVESFTVYINLVNFNQSGSLSTFQIDKASSVIQSLERLNSNYYRHQYTREGEYGFTGDVTINNPWLLSNSEENNVFVTFCCHGNIENVHTSHLCYFRKLK